MADAFEVLDREAEAQEIRVSGTYAQAIREKMWSNEESLRAWTDAASRCNGFRAALTSWRSLGASPRKGS